MWAFGEEFAGLGVLVCGGDVCRSTRKEGCCADAEQDVGGDLHGWGGVGGFVFVVVGIVESALEFFGARRAVDGVSRGEVIQPFFTDLSGVGRCRAWACCGFAPCGWLDDGTRADAFPEGVGFLAKAWISGFAFAVELQPPTGDARLLELVVTYGKKESDGSAEAEMTVILGSEAVGLGKVSDGVFVRAALIEVVALAVGVLHFFGLCIVCVRNGAEERGRKADQTEDEQADCGVDMHRGVLAVWADILKRKRQESLS